MNNKVMMVCVKIMLKYFVMVEMYVNNIELMIKFY